MVETFESKAMRAAERFIDSMGYLLIERNWSCPSGKVDFIVRDELERGLVFMNVLMQEDPSKGIPEDGHDFRWFAEMAMCYLAGHHDELDIHVRYDTLSIVHLCNGRALLRHSKNALGAEMLDDLT